MPANTITFSHSESYEQALQRAADSWGIEPAFWDIWGNWRVASPEALTAILHSLDVPSGTAGQLDAAREARLWEQWSHLAPPTVVAIEGADQEGIGIRIPERASGGELQVEIIREDGFSQQAVVSLSEIRPGGKAVLRGQTFLSLVLPLPADLPLGYHRLLLQLTYGHQERLASETHLIRCPGKAYMPAAQAERHKTAGIAVSLYGLRSDRNWGCGDCTDLEHFSTWAAEKASCSFVALNPLHAIPNRQPYNTSPYLPNCSFYRNYLYLDVERIEEFGASPYARRILETPKMQALLEDLRESKYVEYERVAKLKLRFLKLLYRQFRLELKAGTPKARRFQEYCDAEGSLLRRYATYCALDEVIHRHDRNIWLWTDWPKPYQDPNSPETQQFARDYRRTVQFHQYVQWQLDQQLTTAHQHAQAQGMSIGLYHDLALATDQYGSDLWAHREFYISGCRVGAPPDNFSPKGQDWSFPPPHSEHHWRTGYQLFRDSIRKNCSHGGALRIDHVMRFFRLYWIPPSMDATQGAYVQERFEDLLGILALESMRQKVIVIGEDLGTVAPQVREALARFGILSYRLMYFEKDSKGEFKLPADYPWQALVSATTHDLPTLAGFWNARDIEARKEAGLLPDDGSYDRMIAERNEEKQKMLNALFSLGLLPAGFPRIASQLPKFTGELHYATVGFLASTPSMLLVLNQEDLFKDPEQQNLPGSTEQYPNWRHKVRFKLEELSTNEEAQSYTQMFRDWLKRSSRA